MRQSNLIIKYEIQLQSIFVYVRHLLVPTRLTSCNQQGLHRTSLLTDSIRLFLTTVLQTTRRTRSILYTRLCTFLSLSFIKTSGLCSLCEQLNWNWTCQYSIISSYSISGMIFGIWPFTAGFLLLGINGNFKKLPRSLFFALSLIMIISFDSITIKV